MVILLYQVGIDFSIFFFLFFIVWEILGFIYFKYRLKYLDKVKENPFKKSDLSVFDD